MDRPFLAYLASRPALVELAVAEGLDYREAGAAALPLRDMLAEFARGAGGGVVGRAGDGGLGWGRGVGCGVGLMRG